MSKGRRAAVDAIPMRRTPSRATTISPTISCAAISPPGAPASRPISIRAGAGPMGSSPSASPRFGQVLRQLGIAREERILHLPHRHHRLADRVSRRHQGGRRRGSGQHAAQRERLSLHADRQPRKASGGFRGALSAVRRPHRVMPGPRARDRVGRRGPWPCPASRTCCRARPVRTSRRRPRATTSASGSTPRARPASPRARCMCTPARASPPTSMAARSLGLTENDLVYSVAKLFFAYGLGNAMTFPLAVGATTVLMPGRPTPDTVAELLRRHPVTVFFAVPTFYAAFLASAAAPARAELTLRNCVSAGEALPVDVGRRWSERYGVDILDGLGSTEMLHIFLSNRIGDVPLRHHRQAGARLRYPPGRTTTATRSRAGEMGELQVRGPTSAVMYWNNREQSRAHVPRRVDALRRQVHRGQGRLLRLLRAARRHAQGRRHLRGAVRGRGRAADPSGRARSRRGGVAGRGPPDQAEGLRGAEIRPPRPATQPPRRCRSIAGRSSRPTNIRAGSSSAANCRRPRPAKFSASSCGPRHPALCAPCAASERDRLVEMPQ